MNSTSLIPGAMIEHIFQYDWKYLILSAKKDLSWYYIVSYSLRYHIVVEFTIKDLNCWKLISKCH
jgi:hypothetical protein